MLAIRSAGMGFGSVVGVFDDDDFHNDHDSVGRIRGLVSGEILRFILRVANDRFVENGLRRERFAEGVRRLLVQRQDERFVRVGGGVDGDGDSAGSGWEDRDVRAARMRKEGLAIRDAARGDVDAADGVKGGARDYELGIDFADGLQIR